MLPLLKEKYTPLNFSVSHKNYWMCSDSLDMARNDKLKNVLNEYFDSQTLEESEETTESLEEPVSYHNYCLLKSVSKPKSVF